MKKSKLHMFTVGYGCARLFLPEGSDFLGQIALRVGAFLYAFLHSRGSLKSSIIKQVHLFSRNKCPCHVLDVQALLPLQVLLTSFPRMRALALDTFPLFHFL